MSDSSISSHETLRVRLSDRDPDYLLIRPLQLRAMQWFIRIIIVNTNRSGGTARWRELMDEVLELVAELPPERRNEARDIRQRALVVFRGNTYSTWRPGVAALTRVFIADMEWPRCFNRYVTVEAADEWLRQNLIPYLFAL